MRLGRNDCCWQLAAVILAAAVIVTGCNRVPKGPDAPEISADAAGKQALSKYDTNSDGSLDDSELAASPGLLVAKARVDADGNGSLTAEEIADRIRYWENSGTVVMSGSTAVKLDGQPVEGAKVSFIPEEFLGPAYKQCEGTTDARGEASVVGPDPQFPGIYLGFYRVKISKMKDGKETIPAKYNEETELGWEQSDDLPEVQSVITFDLKS